MQSDTSGKTEKDIAKGHTGGLEPEGNASARRNAYGPHREVSRRGAVRRKAFGKEVPLKALPARPAKGPAAQKVYGHAHTYGSARDT